jgi:hypothetical protein
MENFKLTFTNFKPFSMQGIQEQSMCQNPPQAFPSIPMPRPTPKPTTSKSGIKRHKHFGKSHSGHSDIALLNLNLHPEMASQA